MTGAIGLDPTALGLTGKQLINIDTEDDDEITIGAAGGRDCTLTWKGKDEALEASTCWTAQPRRLKRCGHSGVEINQGRANANRLLARLLLTLSNQCPRTPGQLPWRFAAQCHSRYGYRYLRGRQRQRNVRSRYDRTIDGQLQ